MGIQINGQTDTITSTDGSYTLSGSIDIPSTTALNAAGVNVTGVVTASSFVGDGSSLTGIDATVLKDPDGNVIIQAEASGINVTGVSTFSSNIDVNGDLDVDGHTELDNVNIAGVLTATSAEFSGNVTVLGDLTYEDVTNVDVIGIATARSGLRVTGGGLDVVGVSTFNGDLSITDKIVHEGDTDTAIRFPANDIFTVETAGSERLRVGAGGTVYIGPNGGTFTRGQLHIERALTYLDTNYRNSNLLTLENVTGSQETVQTFIGNYSGSNRYGNIIWTPGSSNDNSYFKINANIQDVNHLVVRGDGDVGIGTDTPAGRVQIDAISGGRALTVNAPTDGAYITFETDNTAYADIGSETGVVGSGSADLCVLNARGARDLAFRTNYTERLRINSSGNIGIGTDNPRTKLEIAGNTTNINGYSDGQVQIVGNNPIAFVSQSNLNPGVNRWGFLVRAANVDGNFSIYDFNNARHALLINSSGNIGIGTDNPLVKTHVVGPSGGGGKLYVDTIGTFSGTDTSTLGFSVFRGGSNVRSNSQAEIECVGDGNYSGSLVFKTQNPGTYPNSLVERLRITASGQVAVNGGSPNANWGPFNVNVDGSNIMHIGYGANYDNYFTTGSSGTQIFRTGSTERFRIGAGGQIGLSGANYGTSGQVLTSQGSGSAAQWASATGDLKPIFYGYDSADTTGVAGWKTFRANTLDANQGVSSSSVYNQSNGHFTPDVAGWYVIHFNFAHINGTHSEFMLRIYHSGYGEIAYKDNTKGHVRSDLSCVTYMNGTGHYVYAQSYHNNNNHGEDNTDRLCSFAVFRLPGAEA